MIETNIESIVKSYSFFTVHSGMNNNSMFNGFIGAEPKNEIIYQALQHIYIVDKQIVNSDYFYICKNLKKIIDKVDSSKFTNKYKIFQEILYPIKAITVNDNIETIVTHYYHYKIIEFPFENKVLKPVHKTKIGITLNLPSTTVDLFANGIKQNALYFNELLLNIGYDSYFIVSNLKHVNQIEVERMMYDTRFKIVKETEVFSFGFDVVIIFDYELPLNVVKQLRYMKIKTVAYLCGNSYVYDSEIFIYHKERQMNGLKYDMKNNFMIYDIIWCIPQFYNLNKYYCEILYRTECIEVPFIWSDKSILLCGEHKQFIYKKKGDKKKIAILEPNLSIIKSGIPPLLICEKSYRKNSEIIDHVFFNNIYGKNDEIMFNLNVLNYFVEQLDLHKDKKISIEKRYHTLFFVSTLADIVVSHQWENSLNYLYFDLAWMGWPIIHNGSLCKDIGYYYDGFNYKEGSEVLDKVLVEHDKNAIQYLEHNRKMIDRYLPSNKKLQDDYHLLIQSLF
jgi:hypothetical protein